MDNMRIMILNGVKNKEYNGVLKVVKSDVSYVKLNLNIPKDNYTLVIKNDKISAYSIKQGIDAVLIYDINLDKDVYAVIAKGKEGVLYGGTGGDKIKAFSLLSEYRNLLNSGEIDIIAGEEYNIPETDNKEKAGKNTNHKVTAPQKNDNKVNDIVENSEGNSVENTGNIDKNVGISADNSINGNYQSEKCNASVLDNKSTESNSVEIDKNVNQSEKCDYSVINKDIKQTEKCNNDSVIIKDIGQAEKCNDSVINDNDNSQSEERTNDSVIDKVIGKDEECNNDSNVNNTAGKFFTSKIFDNYGANGKADFAEVLGEREYFDENLAYKGDNFYMAIHNQIDEMFVCYPEETILNQIVQDSKWVRIEYKKGEYYVLGIVRDDGEVKYICYGIPSMYSIKPPEEVRDIAKWLPLNINEPRGEGYWIIFQDGKNGKTLNAIEV